MNHPFWYSVYWRKSTLINRWVCKKCMAVIEIPEQLMHTETKQLSNHYCVRSYPVGMEFGTETTTFPDGHITFTGAVGEGMYDENKEEPYNEPQA